jgi:hypothetical protein
MPPSDWGTDQKSWDRAATDAARRAEQRETHGGAPLTQAPEGPDAPPRKAPADKATKVRARGSKRR